MFLASNICWVSSGTVSALPIQDKEVEYTQPIIFYLYCWLPLAVRGANPGMKK